LTIPAAQAAEFLERIAAREFPRQMHLTLEAVGHPMSFVVLWQCPEPSCLESGRAFLQNEVASLVNDAHLKISPCTWLDNTYGSNNTMLVQSYTGFLKPINATVDIIRTIIDTLYEWTVNLGSTYVMPDMELWGGRISDISPDATAFPHRDAVYNVGVVVEVPQDQPTLFNDIVGRLNKEWHRVGKYLDGAYVNYQMPSLRQEEYAQAYWGHNVRRLQQIKQKYDPDNMFTYPQGIPPIANLSSVL
jgi:FAD/FMN-containing dehydrogenase